MEAELKAMQVRQVAGRDPGRKMTTKSSGLHKEVTLAGGTEEDVGGEV